MARDSNPEVAVADFPGLVDNMDPKDIPPGAAEEQVNAGSQLAGELLVRRGYRPVTFENI